MTTSPGPDFTSPSRIPNLFEQTDENPYKLSQSFDPGQLMISGYNDAEAAQKNGSDANEPTQQPYEGYGFSTTDLPSLTFGDNNFGFGQLEYNCGSDGEETESFKYPAMEPDEQDQDYGYGSFDTLAQEQELDRIDTPALDDLGTPMQPQNSSASRTSSSASSFEEPEYPCRFQSCRETFRTKRALKQHSKTHDWYPFKCPHQGCLTRGYKENRLLQRHIEEKHQRPRRKLFCPEYECSFHTRFGKAFRSKDNWRTHIKFRHPELDIEALQRELEDLD